MMLVPAGRHGPEFIVTPNFYVIKQYNNSDLYALYIANLADRILPMDQALSRRRGAMSAKCCAPILPPCRKRWKPGGTMSAGRTAFPVSRHDVPSAAGRKAREWQRHAFPIRRWRENFKDLSGPFAGFQAWLANSLEQRYMTFKFLIS